MNPKFKISHLRAQVNSCLGLNRWRAKPSAYLLLLLEFQTGPAPSSTCPRTLVGTETDMKPGNRLKAALATLLLLAIAAPATGEMHPMSNVKLPKPRKEGPLSLEESLNGRRSIRSYTPEPLTLAETSQLLWAIHGINGHGRLTVPSAGALYPLEIYLVSGKIEGLPTAAYRYRPGEHALELQKKGDLRLSLSRAALGQRPIAEAAAVVVITAIYERTTGKYGQRGVRYVQMEVGHAAQNLYLQATSLGLGTVMVGAFDDDEVAAVIGLPDGTVPLGLMPVGKRR